MAYIVYTGVTQYRNTHYARRGPFHNKILKEALNHVKEDGQIPPPYIDHI
jgi:hypothetical protein